MSSSGTTSKPPGRWSAIKLPNGVVKVFEPGIPDPRGFVVLSLHQHHDDVPYMESALTLQAQARGLRLVAPEGDVWWLDRPTLGWEDETPQEFVLNQVMHFAGSVLGAKPPKVGLLGLGTGGQAVLRWAFQRPSVFPVVAAIAPVIDFHKIWDSNPLLQAMFRSEEAARQETATLYVEPMRRVPHVWFSAPDNRELVVEGAERLQSKLLSLGLPFTYTCDENRAAAHVYAAQKLHDALDFITEGLDQSSRSLNLAHD